MRAFWSRRFLHNSFGRLATSHWRRSRREVIGFMMRSLHCTHLVLDRLVQSNVGLQLCCCPLAHSAATVKTNFRFWHRIEASSNDDVSSDILAAPLPFSREACDMNYFMFERVPRMCIFMDKRAELSSNSAKKPFLFSIPQSTQLPTCNSISNSSEVLLEVEKGKHLMLQIK